LRSEIWLHPKLGSYDLLKKGLKTILVLGPQFFKTSRPRPPWPRPRLQKMVWRTVLRPKPV